MGAGCSKNCVVHYHGEKAVAPTHKKKILKFKLGDRLNPHHMSQSRHKNVLGRDAMSFNDITKLPVGVIAPKTTPMVPPQQYSATFLSKGSKTDVEVLLRADGGVAYSTKVKLLGQVNENTTIKAKGNIYNLQAIHTIEVNGIPYKNAEDREREEHDFQYLSDLRVTNTRIVSLHKNDIAQDVLSYNYKQTTGECKVAYSN